jgi:hypothetical protein
MTGCLQSDDNFPLGSCDDGGMKTNARFIVASLLSLSALRGPAAGPPPEPGPEDGGLRLRLLVSPKPEGGREGYDVRIDLVNVSPKPIVLRAAWWSRERGGGFPEYLEAATSIESWPAFEPWLGQTMVRAEDSTPQPEYTLKPAETLSRSWHTQGRHLKNTVDNPLEVQNPEFTQDGLHAVHATVLLAVAGRPVLLRSNEQLVPIGGRRELPKHTYGPLWAADEKTRTARLGLGSVQKIVPGDRFLIHSGIIGMTWTLTITNVEADVSSGTLVPVQENPAPRFPQWGQNAALLPLEKSATISPSVGNDAGRPPSPAGR